MLQRTEGHIVIEFTNHTELRVCTVLSNPRRN